MMERARRLVRYAASMVESPMCKGPGPARYSTRRWVPATREEGCGTRRREALDAVGRATQAYETAREAILEGRPWDALRTLRRIGDRVALSAAKAARSCAAGQTSLTARAADKPKRKRTTRRAKAAPTPTATPGWRPFAEGDRVVLDDVHGIVKRIPAKVYGPGDKVTFLADGNRRGRKVEASRLVWEPAGSAPVATPVADAEKDKALIDAFSAAISAALGAEAA